MAVNFPDNPIVNDEFTSGTRTWIWDGSVWLLKGVPISVANLGDVNLTNLANGDAILYNSTTQEWENGEVDVQGAIDTANAYTDSAVSDLTLYIDGYLDPSTGTTTDYIDQQDAATLAAANAYTDAAIDNVVGLAPEALDTLAELAGALNDDPNFLDNISATTVSDTAPSPAVAGDIWFDSTSGNTYVYFDSFWVEIIGSDGIVSGGGTSYTNTNVDSHLNTGTASSGEVLSWTGSDYSWVAQSSGASLPNSQYIDYQNTSDFAVNVSDLAPLKYSDGTTDLVGQVTVSSGYTRALIELHGNIQAITANDEEAYLMVQRSTDGGSSWTNVKNIQVSALEVDWNNNLNSVYQPFARKVLDTHGVSAGGTVQYRFINNTAGVVGGSANAIRQFFTDVSSVLIVQEVA